MYAILVIVKKVTTSMFIALPMREGLLQGHDQSLRVWSFLLSLASTTL
jgi:hypothetical protein